MSVKNTIRVMRRIYGQNLTDISSAEVLVILGDIEADYDEEMQALHAQLDRLGYPR